MKDPVLRHKGSQTQNFLWATLRKKLSPQAPDQSEEGSDGPHCWDQNQEMLHHMLNYFKNGLIWTTIVLEMRKTT